MSVAPSKNEEWDPSEAGFRLLLDGVRDYAIIRLDAHGHVVSWNEGAGRLFGYAQAEIVGRSIECFYSADALAIGTPKQLLAEAAAEGRCEDEGWRVRKDGTRFFANVILTAIRNSAGELVGFAGVARNISLRNQVEQTLRASEARYRLLADNSTDVIMLVAPDFSKRLYVSPACRNLFGYEPEELLEDPMGKLVHPDDRGAWAEARVRSPHLPENEVMQATYRIVRKDGAHVWVESSRRRLPNDSGYVVSLRDISERKEVEEQLAAANRRLEIHARQDVLTGLANRRHFDETLEVEFRRSIRENATLSLIMIDIDHFKQFNDLYGHPSGDDCLRKVGLTLRDALLRPGDLVARYGGEEFVALLPNTIGIAAAAVAERILKAVRALQIPHLGSPEKIVTISLGAAPMAPLADLHRPEILVKSADLMLYEAKTSGRNRVCSAPPPRQDNIRSQPRRRLAASVNGASAPNPSGPGPSSG